MMLDVQSIKQKIIRIINEKGPSLPVPISRAIELSPTFASAILAELVDERRVKLSNLKVGSSPLYLLPGQEQKLEEHVDDLVGVEKSAYLKLKQNKILIDERQEPAIRVALRKIRDFATPLKFNQKIIWKYMFITNQEAQEKINQLNFQQSKPRLKENPSAPEGGPPKGSKKPSGVLDKPILQLKPKKTKPPSKTAQEFLAEIKQFLQIKDIEFLKEVQIDKKEIIAKIRINSDIGKIILLLIAKDKKRPNIADLTLAYQKAVHEKMPCLFLSRGDPASTTKEFLEQHKNILKIGKIENL